MKPQPEITARMEELGIDVTRSVEILDRRNRGDYDSIMPVKPDSIPEVDGETIIDRTRAASFDLDEEAYRSRLRSTAPELANLELGELRDGVRTLDEAALEELGLLLSPRLAYGVLNGGSATSYADEKKNRAANGRLLDLYRPQFDALAPDLRGRPKGITPAVVNPDGSPGPSFLELTFRMLLLEREAAASCAARHGVTYPEGLEGGLPFFEMTSGATAEPLAEAYASWRTSPLLAPIGGKTLLDGVRSAPQPLLAAMTHSDEGRPFGIFDQAYGRDGEPLGLPGGHGQNFAVLAPIYRDLFALGKRFVYLSNVDNLGSTIDHVSLALLALSGKPAGFDFAFRTPVDVKGGILVRDTEGSLTCADIGVGIDSATVDRRASEGTPILFNCATGLFSLDWLVANLDRIVEELPMRLSDQDKDAGRYSQAEQVTWEIIGMIDRPLVFGIDKYKRFLAAKMVIETFMSSGLNREEAHAIEPSSARLADGMQHLLESRYGMEILDGRWRPRDSA